MGLMVTSGTLSAITFCEDLRDVMAIYDFVAGNTDRKYLLALKYLQGEILGPVTTRALTIDTVGDINKY